MMMRTGLVFVLLLCLCSHSSAQGCNRELLENVDFPGSSFTFVYSPDVHHCQQMCTQNPYCLFFTFIRADWTVDNSNYRCILKKSSSGNPDEQKPQVGVTSGYSLKPCRQISAPCFPQVYVDTNFPGVDYRNLFTSDYKACQRACTEDPGCQFFSSINTVYSDPKRRYKCHLKFSWTVPAPSKVNQLNGVISGFSYYAKISTGNNYFQECQSKYFPDTEISGSDLFNLPAASPEHCQILCSAHPLCTYFIFEITLCFLKNNPNEMKTRAKQGVTSGLPSRFCQQDRSLHCTTFSNIDFYGDDMTFVLLDDAVSCQKACNDNPNCLFYSYVTSSFSNTALRKHCYLKRGITIPAPPIVRKEANVISGFTLQNCAGQPSGVCSV